MDLTHQMNFFRNEEQRLIRREVNERKEEQQLEINKICMLSKFMTFTTLSFLLFFIKFIFPC